MKLQVKKIDKKAKLPTKAHSSDAGWDLYALEAIDIESQTPTKVRTGIAMAIPDGYFGLICDRSSMGVKGISRHAGVIDSSYRGEIIVCLNYVNMPEFNCEMYHGYYPGDESWEIITRNHIYSIAAGDKIAQLVILPVPTLEIEEVKTLEITERGQGGFGSSGR